MTMISSSDSSDAVGLDTRRFQSFANIMLNAWEQWIALNLDTVRSLCVSASVNSRAMVDEALRTQVAAYEEGLERTASYFEALSRLGFRVQTDLAHLQAEAVIESTGSVPSFLDNIGSPSPRTVHGVIAVMKTAVDNGGSIYERFVKTSRELADSNIAVAVRALQPIRTVTRRSVKKPNNLAA